MKSSPKLVCVNNIPTPYRLFFFRLLHQELKHRGWEFEAWFMAQSEPGRYWHFEPSDFPFPSRFFAGFSPNLAGVSFHCNPGMYRELNASPPDVLVSGGAWVMPSTILCSFAPRRTLKVFWSESHYLSLTRDSQLVNRFRRALMLRYDAFAVPGRLAREYVEHFAPGKALLELPNLVDSEAYGTQVKSLRQQKPALRAKRGVAENARVLLIPARLNTSKGILPFLDALLCASAASLHRLTILLAGDGELKSEIESWILKNTSPTVILLGHQSQALMCELYALADAVALPSYSDPNPLTVVEAVWAGLPLLLSDRVGNHYETLTAGLNGWLFTAGTQASVCKAVESWMALSSDQLRQFGEASHAVACRSFEPQTVVRAFVDRLIVLARHR